MILEEGNRPYPRCPKCYMFVLQRALNSRHPYAALCRRGEERKRRRLAAEEAEAGVAMALTAYDRALTSVLSFKCLRRFLLASDDDWTAVIRNLRRARQKWARLSRVL